MDGMGGVYARDKGRGDEGQLNVDGIEPRVVGEGSLIWKG